MDDKPPLGSLEAFKAWSDPRAWGPGSKWRVSFGGGGVMADFVKGLREVPAVVAAALPRKAEAYPVVLGCVPWLTRADVVDALIEVGSCCVVVDKSSVGKPQVARLASEASGVLQMLLPGLEYWAPAVDGKPPVIDPNSASDFHERELDPVRVAGWVKAGKTDVPLLHAKLAVCCAAYKWEGEMGSTDDLLRPIMVWMGSANWTAGSARHLEFGAWIREPTLAQIALEFVADVIRASERFDSTAVQPTPELVEGTWDNDAFADQWAEMQDAEEDLGSDS